MECNQLKHYIEQFVHTFYFTNVNIDVEETVHKGLMGSGFQVYVSGNTGGDKVVLYLYAKVAPVTKNVRSIFPVKLCFEREIYVYENIIPIFEKFQSELVNFSNVNFPKYYFSLKNKIEFLLLENIDGYNAMNKTKFDDISKEICECIKVIGKIHALSMVFQLRNPERYAQVIASMNDIYTSENDENTNYQKSFKNLINLIFRTTNSFLEEDLRKINESIRKKAFLLYKQAVNNSTLKVICHGDCHIWNFLFKYKADSGIEDCKVIDFQLTHAASPAVDFQYLIGCVTSSDQRLKYHKIFTELHYMTIATTLQLFNVDINSVYPKHLYEEDIVNTAIIAFVKTNQSFVFGLGNPENMPELKDFFSGILKPEQLRPIDECQKDIEWIRSNVREYANRYNLFI